jgi:hypothetical protein
MDSMTFLQLKNIDKRFLLFKTKTVKRKLIQLAILDIPLTLSFFQIDAPNSFIPSLEELDLYLQYNTLWLKEEILEW